MHVQFAKSSGPESDWEKKEAFQSNMGCFNTAPLKYHDALRLMRNLDPSRGKYSILLLFEDFFFYYNFFFYSGSLITGKFSVIMLQFQIDFALMCIFLNREGTILPFLSVRDAAGKDPLRDRKEFECFIEMGLKCATFLPDECTDSAEMLTYKMTELSAHSLHPS